MKTKLWLLITVVAGFVLSLTTYSSADDFYKGKTMRFVCGAAPGGGYDLSARMIGRHMSKHIPGNPTIIVDNMTGAGHRVAANYLYNRSEPDGLTVGVWNFALVLFQTLGDKSLRLDPRKLGWIGAPTKGTPVCAMMGHSGLKTFKEVMASTKEIKVAGTGAGTTYEDLPKILNLTLKTNFKVVSGYDGTGPSLVAMRSQEVQGACWTWESMKSRGRSMLDAKGDDKLIPFLIHRRLPDPEVKDLPLIPDLLKGEDLALYKSWAATYEAQRPFILPPGMPRERLELLRKAFADTMKDPEFLAEAKKSKFDTTYVSGEEIEKYTEEILAISPQTREKLQFLMPQRKKK
ncbi:MAG: Bug family tripartite tricarboxylate transporter substrate binding protein [Candidatus Binatia bacterium]